MCLTRLSRRRSHVTAEAGRDAVDVPINKNLPCNQTRGRPVEVAGTWDFKWAPGTQIRVAFQMPVDAAAQRDFEDARTRIIELADTWMKAGANIFFEWIKEPLPPADDIDPQYGSPLEGQVLGHDVLVSLDPLPRTLRDPRTIEPLHRVLLPRAELGTFARRADHSVPTLFIGPVTGRTDTGLAECYAKDSLARYYVVHEFGHVLGLAHEHQNPHRERPDNEHWSKVDEIYEHLKELEARPLHESDGVEREKLKAERLKLRGYIAEVLAPIRRRVKEFFFDEHIPLVLDEITLDDFIYSQLIQPWPGNPAFSDWRNEAEFDADSVMGLPFLGCFFGLHGNAEYQPQCKTCRRFLVQNPQPTQSDYDHLVTMYGKAL